MAKYTVFSLDVWGHSPEECPEGSAESCECSGFTVNDRARVDAVTFPDDASDGVIIRTLKDASILEELPRFWFDVEASDDWFIMINRRKDGRPLLMLELES